MGGVSGGRDEFMLCRILWVNLNLELTQSVWNACSSNAKMGLKGFCRMHFPIRSHWSQQHQAAWQPVLCFASVPFCTIWSGFSVEQSFLFKWWQLETSPVWHAYMHLLIQLLIQLHAYMHQLIQVRVPVATFFYLEANNNMLKKRTRPVFTILSKIDIFLFFLFLHFPVLILLSLWFSLLFGLFLALSVLSWMQLKPQSPEELSCSWMNLCYTF